MIMRGNAGELGAGFIFHVATINRRDASVSAGTSKACLPLGNQAGFTGGEAAHRSLPTPSATAASPASILACLFCLPARPPTSSSGPLGDTQSPGKAYGGHSLKVAVMTFAHLQLNAFSDG